MSTNLPDFSSAQRAVVQTMREHWVLFLVEGIVLVLLGLLAIVIPPLATLAVTILVGWLFLISGIVAGVVLLAWPISGTVSLTLVLIVFFIMEGVASIMYGIEHRKEASSRAGWIIASGVIDLILAAIIFSGLPGSAAWALGLLVGINMVFGGTSLVAMALGAHSQAGSPPTTTTGSPPTTPTAARAS
jgi:uncharacterized membrane protein HdeD (DUF308 family)